MNRLKSNLASKKGFTLVEMITSAAILALVSLLVFGASCPMRIAIKQAASETMASSMAFAVLDAIRAEAPDLDLGGSLDLNDLGLSNPNNLKVTVQTEQDISLPDLYLVTVTVKEQNAHACPVTMRTLVRS